VYFLSNLRLTIPYFGVYDSIDLRHRPALVGACAVKAVELLGICIHHMRKASPGQEILDLALVNG
jgi:hypothetical protein